MAGFDLKEGFYEDREVSEDELWDAVACVFTSKSKNDASYKFGFLKFILDNLKYVDNDLVLSFDQLFTRFAELYWNLILEYNLRQKAITKDNRKSAIERVLLEAKDKYVTDDVRSFDSYPQSVRSDVSHQVKMKCKIYVVGALFEDTKHLFYSFSKKGEWIKLNPRMYSFVCERRDEIEKLNNYEWAHFLGKVNPGYSTNDILTKYLLKTRRSQMNTTEMLIEAEEAGRNKIQLIEPNTSLVKDNDEIDEEAITLLDDPVALIKLLKSLTIRLLSSTLYPFAILSSALSITLST